MRKIRKQPREEVSAEEFINAEKNLDLIVSTPKEQSNQLKDESIASNLNDIIKIMKMGLTANQLKLIEAIEKEAKDTGTPVPPMSTNYISSKYGINPKYLGDAIKGLIEKGLLKRYPAKFRGQKSFSYEVIKQ